jgi:prolyl-tRNA editing enzyme YbaK/EbsC (Cys-tRNA(Pro) deacylase)
LHIKVVELPASTRNAPDAARAIGCQIEQIAKSIIFRGYQSDRSILVIASRKNRVDERWLVSCYNKSSGRPIFAVKLG